MRARAVRRALITAAVLAGAAWSNAPLFPGFTLNPLMYPGVLV